MSEVEERIQRLGVFIVEQKATVRAAAAKFGVSKSTVHKDVTQRLRDINGGLWKQVSEVLRINKEERHLRGGLATKEKYARLHKRG